jgi:hypothetical protein
MNDDEILILLFLYQNPESTTTEIAKNLFPDKILQPDIPDAKKRKNKELSRLRSEDRRVRYYLDRFVDSGLATLNQEVSKKGKKNRYSLNSENVYLGVARIELITLTGDEISIGFGRVLLCKSGDSVLMDPLPEDHPEC